MFRRSRRLLLDLARPLLLAGLVASSQSPSVGRAQQPSERVRPGNPANERDAPGDDARPPEVDREELARLVRDLDADSFRVRQHATARLMMLGDAAYDVLVEASRSESKEVRARASFILRDRLERSLRQAFADLASKPDADRDVEYGMWLIARIMSPRVPREKLTRELDRLARRVRENLGPGVDPAKCEPRVAMETLRKTLFEDEGFRGAVVNYTNPENSCLDRVLQRKQGLPILLSHVVIAVARRLGWPLVGVPTPGRYIVRYEGRLAPAGWPKEDLFMDPFGGGRIPTVPELELMFPGLDAADLAEKSSNAEILIRILNNLETHLDQSGQRALAELAVICKVELQNAAPLD